MTRIVLRTVYALGLAFSLATLAQPAIAQSTSKVIRFVVPFPPGGVTDITARIMAPKLAEALGETIVVENRSGAGGNIGAAAVARAEPDGQTLLLSSVSAAISPSLYRNLPYNPRRDLTPIALIGEAPSVLVVRADSKLKTLRDLIELARRNPGKLNYASLTAGSSVHLATELFKYRAKVFITHIPYRGAPAAMMALLGGEVDMMMDALSPSLEQLRAGKTHALAVTSAQRSPLLPDVPTIAESGFPGYEMTAWSGISTTAGTPAERIAQLEAAVQKAHANPEVQSALRRQGMSPRFLNAIDYGAFINAETAKFAAVVKSLGITAE